MPYGIKRGNSMYNFDKLLKTSADQLESMNIDKLADVGLERTMDSYYLCGQYPPMLQMENIALEKHHNINFNKPIGQKNEYIDMYLHFPFCKVVGDYQCSFCHFYKVEYDLKRELNVIENWIKEIDLWKQKIGNIKIKTLYFGGGTQSLMQPESLKKFISYLNTAVDMSKCQEVKFEIYATSAREPDNFNQLLEVLKTLPKVKPIIDIPSFNPLALQNVTWSRVTEEDYHKTLQTVIDHEFKDISTGFITGLPFETKESMLHNLAKLASIPQIKSITNYPLMIRRKNQVNGFVTQCPELMMDIKDRDIIAIASRKLLSGFGFTENPLYFFSRDGGTPIQSQSKKNSQIETNLLGIGPSAFGNINDVAYYNHPSIQTVNERLSDGILPISNFAVLDNGNREVKRIIEGEFYGLNNNISVNSEIQPIIEKFHSDELVDKAENNTWKLTEKGKLRIEEMAYYIAEHDLGEKLTSVTPEDIDNNINNCFPTRTEEQISKWKAR
jgi:oxygen-independent coproporphyrinogen-3 oxidase